MPDLTGLNDNTPIDSGAISSPEPGMISSRTPILDSAGRVVGWINNLTGDFTILPSGLGGQFVQKVLPVGKKSGRRTNRKRTAPKVKKVVSSVSGGKALSTNIRGEVTHVTSSLLKGTKSKPTLRGTRVKALPVANVLYATPQAVAFNHRDPITAKVANKSAKAPMQPVHIPEPAPPQKRKAESTPPPPERRVVARSSRLKFD